MNRICTINRCMKLQLHSAHYCPPYGTGTDFSFDLSDLSLWGASSFLLVFSVSISWLRLRPQILMSSLLKFLFHSGLQARIAFLTVVWTPTDNVCCSPTSKKPWKRQDTRVIKTGDFRDFPGDPVVETPSFQCKGQGFNSWSQNSKIPFCCKALPPLIPTPPK